MTSRETDAAWSVAAVHAERRAYITADPTARLLARIADLEAELEALRADYETAKDKAWQDGYNEAKVEYDSD